MTSHADGPFRTYPWPLDQVRNVLRYVRLQRIKSRGTMQFVYGQSISVARNADIRAPHFFEMGDCISIGKNFTCEVDVRIGNNVLISSNVSMIGRDHPFGDPETTVYHATRTDDSVIDVGSNVLIGFGTIVIGTTKIGDGCIIGAGSVVVNDLPPYMVCVGVPAKPIKHRFPSGAPIEEAD